MLLSIVVEFFFSNIYLVYFAYGSQLDGILSWARNLFLILPAFHYSKMYGDIALKSANHYDILQNRFIAVRLIIYFFHY